LLLRSIVALDDRRDIAAIIVDSSFGSYQALARDKLAGHWLTFLFQPLASILVSVRYAPQSVLKDIAPLPLLVIHGGRDKIVPCQHGQQLYEQALPPKWFWKLEDVGHIGSMAPQHRQHRKALLNFLGHLPENFVP
jgi:fermentation-respiration switch protein FrsA (DUF1100 family)